jgi:hypothetical protein
MRTSRVATVLLTLPLAFAGTAFGADNTIITPPGAKPGDNFSQGILTHDGTLDISGQAGEDAAGKIPADFETEVNTNFFKEPRSTRTTVLVAGLVGSGNIEITVTARK